MSNDLVDFLREVAEVDGVIDEREEVMLKGVEEIFEEKARKSFGKSFAGFKDGLTSKVKTGALAVATAGQTLGSSAASRADAIAKSEALKSLKDGVESCADVASASIGDAADRASKAAAALTLKFKK